MENNTTAVELLIQRMEEYGKTTLTLFRLKAVNKSANLFSYFAIKLVLVLVVVLLLFTFSIGISLWIGELLGKSYYGFFVVTGSYMFIGLLIYLFRIALIATPVQNAVITEMLKRDDDEK